MMNNRLKKWRFFWPSLLRWGGALIITIGLITELVFPTSFGILPSFRLWKLAFNGVVLIGWIVSFGYAFRMIKEKADFSSFRQAFLANLALVIGMPLFFGLMVLTERALARRKLRRFNGGSEVCPGLSPCIA